VLVSTVLYPLFTDSVWFAVATGGVIVVAAAGALTRLRPLPASACLAGSVAALLLYLNLVFEARPSLLFVIPTPRSLIRLIELVGTGVHESRTHLPPVPNLAGLLLLAAGGVGITAALTDLIAVRLRSTALAGLPLLVLFTVPVMINARASQLSTGLVFCVGGAGYLAMLSADGRERIRVWGRLVSLWRSGPRRASGLEPGPDTRALAAAGRRVGLASIVLALCAPLLLPGLHPSKLFASGPGIGNAGGGEGGTILGLPGVLSKTIADLRDKHTSEMFSYVTNASQSLQKNDPQYFRQYVSDTLTTDSGWVLASYQDNAAQTTAIPPPAGLADPSSFPLVTTTVHAGSDFTSSGSLPLFLPTPYPPVRVSAPGVWMVDPDFMVYSDGGSLANQAYTVTSLAVDPTATDLGAAPPAPDMPTDLQLPPSYRTPTLTRLARQITAGQSTEYGKALALAKWLQSNGNYDAAAPSFSDAAGLETFLTKTRSGVCVQFAFAMAVLARLVDIPARMVDGFTTGTLQSRDHYVVTTGDDHAWTEVYFPGFGWIRFEPTPAGQGTASDPNYMSSQPQGTNGVPPPIPASQSSAVPTPSTSPGFNHHIRPLPGSQGQTAGAAAGRAATPWTAVALAVIAALVLALITPAVFRLAARRWRWIRARDDTSRAHAAWHDLHDDLADYGVTSPPSEPPRTLAARITTTLPPPAAAAITRLALAEERASYAARPTASQHLRHDGTTARRGLAATARRTTRWRATLFPASMTTALTHAATRIPDQAAALKPRRHTHRKT
jgi:TgpA N-terminal domain/Transglutaminase-like superfamily